MGELSRFGVSIEEELLRRFDGLIEKRYFPNRSHAIRELIRAATVEAEWEGGGEVAGALVIVYDHHARNLNNRLTALQHDFGDVIISAMHVHMDHYNCLEVLALQGQAGRIAALRDRIGAIKGVKQVRLSVVAGAG